MTARDPAPVRGHTPGKWEARGDHVGVWHRYKSGAKDMIHFVALASVSIPRRRKEVRSYHDGVAEMTANAKLIAAAPELLAALEEILPLVQEVCSGYRIAKVRTLLVAVRGRP